LSPGAWRNGVLLAASLIFYAFDAGWMIWILIASILFNHAIAQLLPRLAGRPRHIVFGAAVALNLSVLLHYKYTAFLWGIGGQLAGKFGIEFGPPQSLELPIGISFFTFQAISYIADVYGGVVAPARRLLDFAMYHSLFPQLIAGPIVRYVEVADAVHKRENDIERIAQGAFRFCIGLGKKLLVADAMGAVADPIFQMPIGELTFPLAWTALVCYTLQIYFDFSGYSDMAIGLGAMLGFRFPENFLQPYRARSITEFWRLWHMTLSRWFRDYVYIPLGGNRRGPWRTYLNLVIVFLLCGLWHGAGYTFIVWGLYHGALLVTERLYRNYLGPLPKGYLAWFVTLFLVMIGWAIFRSPTLSYATSFMTILFGFAWQEGAYFQVQSFLTADKLAVLLIGAFFALAPLGHINWRLDGHPATVFLKGFAGLTIMICAIVALSARNFNPFIYFRF